MQEDNLGGPRSLNLVLVSTSATTVNSLVSATKLTSATDPGMREMRQGGSLS